MSATDYDTQNVPGSANNVTVDKARQTIQHYPFNFTGTGSEYFRIWIVNLLLSILTFGIYSAWAKVRTKRYLYGHTEVAGGRFDYHANPVTILVGRLVAIFTLLVYVFASEFWPVVALVFFLGLIVLTPIIIVRAFNFNARMSSWRGIRFGFDGSAIEAAIAYLLLPPVGFLLLGLGIPYAWYRQARFNINGHRFGQTHFQIGASTGEFYLIALILWVVSFGLLILFSAFAGAAGVLGSAVPEEAMQAGGVIVLIVVGALGYATIGALYSGLRFRTLYTDLQIGENWIQSDVSVGRFVFIVVTNSVGLLFTLGLYYPWAKIRMTNFLLESLTLEATDLDGFIAARQSDSNALGEELGSAFDLDIGI